MNINPFRKEKPQTKVEPFVESQIRPVFDSVFNFGYVPLTVNLGVYRMLREAIPMLDVVPSIYSRLIGDFELKAERPADQEILDDFQDNVKVNYFQSGFHSWLWQMRDSAIALGFGVGEVVPQKSFTDVNRLQNASADKFVFMKEGEQLKFGTITNNTFQPVKLANQDYVKYLAYDMRDGHPQGVSIYYSLPFVGTVMASMQQNIKNIFERIGSPSFLAWVQGGEKTSEDTVARVAEKLKDGLYNVFYYKREGKNRDIAAGVPHGGSLHLDVIGGNQTLIEFEWPYHIIAEQAVCKLEIPAVFFGLYKWDSRQSMSGDQRDMLAAKVNMMRLIEEPMINDIVRIKLALIGKADLQYELKWDDIPLTDEEMSARARMLDASAKEKIVNYVEKSFINGWMDLPEVLEYLNQNGIETGSAKAVERLTQKQQLQFIKMLAEDLK